MQYGTFSLIGADEWKKGIGEFYKRDWSLADHPYFAIQQRERERETYLGSWMIVKELLRSRELKGDLRLFDTSDSVANALKGEAGYSQSSGFQIVLPGSRRPDMILCDPAYSEQREKDWRSIREFASKCIGDNLSALIWYPVYKNDPPLATFAEKRHCRGPLALPRSESNNAWLWHDCPRSSRANRSGDWEGFE